MAQLSIEPSEHVTYKLRYQDDHVLVVGKPPGVVTTPGKGHDYNSLLNGLFFTYGERLQKLGKTRDFGLLHRLDRGTSGLVLVALSVAAYDTLRSTFEQRSVSKYYWAVVKQAPKKVKGVINRPILEFTGKVPNDPRPKKLGKIAASGKPAVTAYRVLAASNSAALVECRAVTGRLHQIRVHMDSIGCPILGDDFYAPAAMRDAAPRLALHAHRIVFKHPVTGAKVDVKSPWPADLRALLKRMSLPRPDEMPATAPELEVPEIDDEA
ncbi:MAG: RluA family pseudouridine synthase [Planctomycetota bacterium]|nr:RluA family pseudouridine synthase [Planctomycetota bacterium]